jgi:S1-C subfamily serine protease
MNIRFCFLLVTGVFLNVIVMVKGVNAASFDCAHATYPIEKYLCDNARLSQLDEKMAETYFTLRESALPKPFKQRLLDEQRDWLAERTDKCPLASATATTCLMKLYKERIAFFEAYAGLPKDVSVKPDVVKREAFVPVQPVNQAPTQSSQIDYASLYDKLSPAIAVVLASSSYERFFEEEGVSQGSGVAISPSFIVTNCHVIEGQDAYIVIQDGEAYTATLDSGRYYADLCVLQIDEKKLPHYLPKSRLSFSSKLRVGQPVLAIGSPRGLENTLSTGIVSGIRKGERVTLLQTTAPISHGSSGGGLFDADGNLIGVTTLQYNNAQALNFAVSVDHLDLPK